MSLLQAQLAICARFGVEHFPTLPSAKVGIAQDALDGGWPVNALRHSPEGEASGWYIWAGEDLSQPPNYFAPFHASHLGVLCPTVVPYLGLPPGWRILIAEGHDDVWFDAALLDPGA
ncbi:hypothetical protein [Caulobacter sp. NIBR1757]|uniref:immunity protein Imm33 domain-containing protein n=1 Tax=Caulobacter sp. NIBR1757 TaxID=3016000 RepID=UPI0022F0E3DB|nr:hypothetical protein [Caulobacter sp. NIBR1757]